ncbi:ComEC/Rec2 family competence protein [Paenibacillus sanguinis]|uniref:ComEC/Rec2 family competence protein n=1 Tax=Paenibacillus sanguinis TaxID=225906 RepID=UPI000360C2E8|nr:ComEC/Rec2 family competence protein [Paenibacillus sanguinis]
MRRRPLTAIAVCWLLGSGLAAGSSSRVFWLLWLGISLLAVVSVIVLRMPWRKLILFWLIFTLGASYWLYNEARNVSHIAIPPGESAWEGRVEGMIVSRVEVDGDRADFTLKVHRLIQSQGTEQEIRGGEQVAVQLRLSAKAELQTTKQWKRGQRISLSGSLQEPQVARNFGGFDYRRYLHIQRIHWLLKAEGASTLKVESGSHGITAFFGKVDEVRYTLGERIEWLFPGWQAGYMKGLLIGLQDELEPDKYTEFTNLGLTHILAISGSHVAINIGLLFGLLRLCRATRETALNVVMGFIPVYMLLTGFSPSVIRSGLMTMLGIYLLRQGRWKDSLNILAAVAWLMLLWEPYYLLNVSFQLSFAVTAGLIIFVPLLNRYFQWLPPKIGGAIAITLTAQMVSFPLTITYFNQFSLLSILANLLLVPVIGVIALPLGTGALLLSLLPAKLGLWAAIPVRWLNNATFVVTEWFSGRGGFMTYWRSPDIGWILAFYGLCYFVLVMGRERQQQADVWPANVGAVGDTVPLGARKASAWEQAATCLATDGLAMIGSGRSFPLDARQWGCAIYRIVMERPAALLRLAAMAGLVLLLVLGYRTAYVKGTGYVEFIDIGQGDSALITTPSGAHILVDGGGTVSFRKAKDNWRERREPFEVGAKTLAPLLKKRGIHRLGAVILTHGDQDHIGGVQAILEQFRVESLLINGSLSPSVTMTKLMKTALSKRIPVYSVSRGMQLVPDKDTRLQFLYPQSGTAAAGTLPVDKEQNHRSIVFMLEMNGASFLFTGDMDEAAERKALALEQADKGGDNPIHKHSIDVLKVAHHGSKTSTSAVWLDYWRPERALISAGAKNVYGHPHPTVVERLDERRVQIYRTDQQGEVQLQVRRERQIEARFKLSVEPR